MVGVEGTEELAFLLALRDTLIIPLSYTPILHTVRAIIAKATATDRAHVGPQITAEIGDGKLQSARLSGVVCWSPYQSLHQLFTQHSSTPGFAHQHVT
jgi:hypothetical protein